jgi:hypothetical protein
MDTESAIAATGLFDARWYLADNEDVRHAKLDPLKHYAAYGAKEKRAPNAYFDPHWYPGSLLHYASEGEAAGLSPSAYFDPAWYRAAYDLPHDASPLADYLRNRGRLPSAQFYAVRHCEGYAPQNRDDDPHARWIQDRAKAGLPIEADSEIIAASGLFDLNLYLINGTDVHSRSLDAIGHFCNFGWREGRFPNLYFDTAWYLATNPDARKLGINPLTHYLLEGERAGRRPVAYFDPVWYRKHYRIPPAQSALAHYLRVRRKQRHSPTPLFDLEHYMAAHGGEVGQNRDPFAHFLHAATYADISPSAAFDALRHRKPRRSRHFRGLLTPERDNALVHYLLGEYQ